jgi:hypothetical protein
MSGDDAGDKVGYGQPPKRTQFKPGQSGNPKGRPRKGEVDVVAVLDEPVFVRQGGVTRKMPAFEAIVRKLVERALKDGKIAAALEFLHLCEKYKALRLPPKPPASSVVVIRNWPFERWGELVEACHSQLRPDAPPDPTDTE